MLFALKILLKETKKRSADEIFYVTCKQELNADKILCQVIWQSSLVTLWCGYSLFCCMWENTSAMISCLLNAFCRFIYLKQNYHATASSPLLTVRNVIVVYFKCHKLEVNHNIVVVQLQDNKNPDQHFKILIRKRRSRWPILMSEEFI